MLVLLVILTIIFGLGCIGEIDPKEAKRYTVCFIVCLVLTVAVWAIGVVA